MTAKEVRAQGGGEFRRREIAQEGRAEEVRAKEVIAQEVRAKEVIAQGVRAKEVRDSSGGDS